jgi:predicted PurR-regulated permease PerM
MPVTEEERERVWRIIRVSNTVLALLVFFMLVILAGFGYLVTQTNHKLDDVKQIDEVLADQAALSRCTLAQISDYETSQWSNLSDALQGLIDQNDAVIQASVSQMRDRRPGASAETIQQRIQHKCVAELKAVSANGGLTP